MNAHYQTFPIRDEQVIDTPERTISEAQLRANRANAKLSTGPRSETGKRISSSNAVRTGLTGNTVLLAGDDAAQYELHVRRFLNEYKPAGDRESELVQSLADTQWRLNRIPSLEMNIYALGRLQFANQFVLQDPEVAAALLEAHIFLTYQKQLNNLSIQENRLRRNFQKDLAELAQLQKERAENERTGRGAPSGLPVVRDSEDERKAATLAPSAEPISIAAAGAASEPAPAVENGFEFSSAASAEVLVAGPGFESATYALASPSES
ncbi:MAG: hypothetical protein JOZ62_20505 [Acidobacteriaceae bacterium]|nr:hypothetical protein [Acidobacteriaceae bacterium]